MKLSTLILSFVCVACSTSSRALAEEVYKPTIPPGYSAELVLQVEYGETPDKAGVEWGDTPTAWGEYSERASMQDLKVVGDLFYFVDDTSRVIKVFRSPGELVWVSDHFFNLTCYTVAPDGKVYVLWDTAVDALSCLDARGKLLWTQRNIVSMEKREQFGLRTVNVNRPEWTIHGLTLQIVGDDKGGNQRHLIALVDATGKALSAIPGRFVDSKGEFVDYRGSNASGEYLLSPMKSRGKGGSMRREVSLDFRANNGYYLKGAAADGNIYRILSDPAGGFIVESSGFLSKRIQRGPKLRDTGLEIIVWRFDSDGKVKEQWRVLAEPFTRRSLPIVVGSDGNVYHLKYGETGITVMKYSQPGKEKENRPSNNPTD